MRKLLFLLLFVISGIVLTRTAMFSAPDSEAWTAISLPNPSPEAVKHLAKSIRYQTIATNDDNKIHAEQFKRFHTFLRQSYPLVFKHLHTEKVGAFGILMRWNGQDKKLAPILLMAHQDVVPIAKGTTRKWDQPPFSGNIHNGYVWGRGTIDDKASLIAILESTQMLLKKHQCPKRTTYFYFGDNEEIGGKTAKLAAQMLKKRNVQFDYVLDEGGGVFNNAIKGVREPIAFISTAEKGYIDVELSINAAGGHSSMPPKKTAIGQISDAIRLLEEQQMTMHLRGLTQQFFETVSKHMNFTSRMAMANLWLFKPIVISRLSKKPMTNALLRTTTAPTIFNAGVKANVLPQKASAIVNFRILPGDTTNDVLEHVRKTIDNDNIKITKLKGWNPSPVSSTEAEGFTLLKNNILRFAKSNVIITPSLIVGATDSRHFIPVAKNVYRFAMMQIDMSDLKRFHGTNERLSIENFKNMVKFYYAMMTS